MMMEKKTMEEIARVVGLKTASGVSNIAISIREKIGKLLESSGYSGRSDFGLILEKIKHHILF
jgi:hypothetical protein